VGNVETWKYVVNIMGIPSWFNTFSMMFGQTQMIRLEKDCHFGSSPGVRWYPNSWMFLLMENPIPPQKMITAGIT
jgi:hypothetical protein